MCKCTPSIRTPYCGAWNCRPESDSTDASSLVSSPFPFGSSYYISPAALGKIAEPFIKVAAAVKTMKSLGYTWNGGKLWKPPLGTKPAFMKEEKVVYQYYYKTNNCESRTTKCHNCICWHDEGSGPLERNQHNPSSEGWRVKPPEIEDNGEEHF